MTAKDISIGLSHGGLWRTAVLHVYPSYSPTHAPPLVLNWHMLGGGAEYQSIYSGDQSTGATFSDLADAHGMLVLYPQGYGNSWNAGACCSPAGAGGDVDDVGFARAVLAQVASQGYMFDTSRVFSTGMSNGADMSYRLLCEASDLVTAIAPVAGVIGNVKNWVQLATEDDGGEAGDGAGNSMQYFDCTDVTHPVSVLHIHGETDALCMYKGQTGFRRSVASTLDIVRSLNGNQAKFKKTISIDSTVCQAAVSGGNNLTLCHTASGDCSGHKWPAGRPDYGGTYVCPPGLHASQQILRFFSDQSARAPRPTLETLPVAGLGAALDLVPGLGGGDLGGSRRKASVVGSEVGSEVQSMPTRQTEGEVRYQLSLVMQTDVLPVDAINASCSSRGYSSTALAVCQPRMHRISRGGEGKSEEGGEGGERTSVAQPRERPPPKSTARMGKVDEVDEALMRIRAALAAAGRKGQDIAELRGVLGLVKEETEALLSQLESHETFRHQ